MITLTCNTLDRNFRVIGTDPKVIKYLVKLTLKANTNIPFGITRLSNN